MPNNTHLALGIALEKLPDKAFYSLLIEALEERALLAELTAEDRLADNRSIDARPLFKRCDAITAVVEAIEVVERLPEWKLPGQPE